jgi:hypothetical protein
MEPVAGIPTPIPVSPLIPFGTLAAKSEEGRSENVSCRPGVKQEHHLQAWEGWTLLQLERAMSDRQRRPCGWTVVRSGEENGERKNHQTWSLVRSQASNGSSLEDGDRRPRRDHRERRRHYGEDRRRLMSWRDACLISSGCNLQKRRDDNLDDQIGCDQNLRARASAQENEAS